MEKEIKVTREQFEKEITDAFEHLAKATSHMMDAANILMGYIPEKVLAERQAKEQQRMAGAAVEEGGEA